MLEWILDQFLTSPNDGILVSCAITPSEDDIIYGRPQQPQIFGNPL